MIPDVIDNELKLVNGLYYYANDFRKAFYSDGLCIAKERLSLTGFDVFNYKTRTRKQARHINHIIKYLKRNKISIFEYHIFNKHLLFNERDFIKYCPQHRLDYRFLSQP